MSSPESPAADDPRYPGPTEPMAPALMRHGHELAMKRLFAHWKVHGFGDVRPHHSPILAFPGPHLARPSDIAARTDRSKQHINTLLNELQDAGYLKRRDDPNDNRGKIIHLTDRGMELMAAGRDALDAIEADWEHTLGARRFAALKRTLQDLQDANGDPPAQTRATH
jgi:DNA-binding MarR family transcriptional regulator